MLVCNMLHKLHLSAIKKTIVPILKKRGVIKSSIFGSFSRGEERESSDLDLLVELPPEADLFDYIDLKHALEDALDMKVDMVEFSAIKPRIREGILNDQIAIL